MHLDPLDVKIPNYKTRAGTNSFAIKGPAFWNEIANETRSTNQKIYFKRKMKESLLHSYEQKSNCTNPRCKDKTNHLCSN